MDDSFEKQKIVIAGFPRCGSSWVSTIFAQLKNYDSIFEPDNPNRIGSKIKIQKWHHIQSEEKDPELEKFFNWILNDKQVPIGTFEHPRNSLKDQMIFLASQIGLNSLRLRKVSEKRIIKLIRSSMFLPWLKETFPEVSILYLMRHPCGQFNSWKKQNWNAKPEEIFDQRLLREKYLTEHTHLLDEAKTYWEKAGLLWGAKHHIISRQLEEKNDQFRVVKFEDFCLNPLDKFKEEFENLGLVFDKEIIKLIEATTSGQDSPYMTHSLYSIYGNSKNTAETWKNEVSKKEQNECMRFANAFGQKFY